MKKNKAYTLAEVVIVILIVAVIVGVSIRITKAKLNQITSFTYYNAYSTLRAVGNEMLSDFDGVDYLNPDFDPTAMNNKESFFAKLKNLFLQPAIAEDIYGEPDPNDDPVEPEDPEVVTCSGEPPCGKTCVDNEWVDAESKTICIVNRNTEWHDGEDCGCHDIPKTVPRY